MTARVLFLKGLLEKVGIDAEFLQQGRYKGAAESLTRKTMSPALREALSAILDNTYATLVDAVAKLQEYHPDVMLLDIEMPRMDGFELARHMKNSEELRDIPIIIITSRTGEKHRNVAMELGVKRYLGKPYQETELLENIHDVLAEKAAE